MHCRSFIYYLTEHALPFFHLLFDRTRALSFFHLLFDRTREHNFNIDLTFTLHIAFYIGFFISWK